MPIYDIACRKCDYKGEVLAINRTDPVICPSCGTDDVEKLMSATSALTGKTPQRVPGPGDTSCCGSRPSEAGCSGPGSCCGRG